MRVALNNKDIESLWNYLRCDDVNTFPLEVT